MPSTLTTNGERTRPSENNSVCLFLFRCLNKIERYHLGKEKKRAERSQTPSEASASIGGVNPDELISALEKIRKEQVPTDHDERHQYFMTQVSMGETMSVKGVSTEPFQDVHSRVSRARFLYARCTLLLPRDSGVPFTSRVDHGLRKEPFSSRIPG